MEKKNKKPRIIGIIPARGGSKGVPRKNIRPLLGKPLISYMLQAALGSKYLTTVVVSSDDNEILAVAKKYGMVGSRKVVLIKRPKELARGSSPSLPTIEHAVNKIEKEEGEPYDYVVMLQLTTPLTTSQDIDGTLKKLVDTKADAVMSVFKSNDMHPAKMKKITKDDKLTQYVDGLKEVQNTRQKFISVYKRNGAIYASKRSVVMKKGQLYGQSKNTRPYIIPRERSVDVNDMTDFIILESMIKYFAKNKAKPKKRRK